MAAAPPAPPQLFVREVRDHGRHVFADLLQGVRGRLQVRLDAGHRSAQPDFGDVFHTGR